jgi:hypothetical protein
MSFKHAKAPIDPRGGHIRLYWELIDSNAWRCLSASDQRAYIALARHLRSTNNGRSVIAVVCGKATRHKEPNHPGQELARTGGGRVAGGVQAGRQHEGRAAAANALSFTDVQAYANPAKFIEASKATNDWKSVATLGMGREAIRQAEIAAKDDAVKLKTLVQKMDVTSPEIGGVKPKTSPKNGLWAVRPVQKMDLAKAARSAVKPIATRS